MQKVACQPPAPWELPDIVVVLFLPIAALLVLIDALAIRGAIYAKETNRTKRACTNG